MAFLGKFIDHAARPLTLAINGLVPQALFVGQGENTVEVVVLEYQQGDPQIQARAAFKKRRGKRSATVLVVVVMPQGDGAWIAGAHSENPEVCKCDDLQQAEHICDEALSFTDRHSAIRYLRTALPSLETELPGITNEGLLSTYQLKEEIRSAKVTPDVREKATSAIGSKNKQLLGKLGFRSEKLDNLTDILFTNNDDERKIALAVLLKDGELEETSQDRFNSTSPVSYALAKADKQNLPWVVMVQGSRIRLYNTKNIGVGRRGRTETWVQCQTSLLSHKQSSLLWFLFSADALKSGGTIDSILEKSRRFAAGVAERLRERIYDIVIPELAMGIAVARGIKKPSKDDLALTYEMALMVLFRLLFIAYAEDRDLLPYKTNVAYHKRSLKQKAQELKEAAEALEKTSKGNHHWGEAANLWRAISIGNVEWGIPAYNGAMFSSERNISKAGAELAQIALPNDRFVEALKALLLTDAEENTYAPIDFRTLSVREFGTIYEGLLESELSLAEQDLTQDKNDAYIPAAKGDNVRVKKGKIYLHNRSGARKSSGSYYTPDFAVEHLMDGALEPALKEHLARMEGLGEADRTEQFFDFRVADISMGSGHFLVAAIDRIEHCFALWLDDNPTPGITRELQYLREAAKNELISLKKQRPMEEEEADEPVVIEDGQLLRRMIARRCIYGVDLNPLAVQLARLSIWIHTFVPGLPLSLLDHNLVHGNALVGIGSLDEIKNKLEEHKDTLFEADADDLLGKAKKPLMKLARLSDASLKDIDKGRRLIAEAREKTRGTEALCDLITAQPVAEHSSLKGFPFQDWEELKAKILDSSELKLAKEILEPLSALHFPIAFPEVFLGRSQGFNVIIGNPPWEKVKVEEYNFWAQRFPGLRGLPQREFEQKKKELHTERPDLVTDMEKEQQRTLNLRNILHSSSAFTMGTGDPDLYQAFAWRFWHVTSSVIGKIGVVLPRYAMAAKGFAIFRKELFKSASSIDLTTLLNTGRWVFNIHPQSTIALICLSKSGIENCGITIRGSFNSMQKYDDGIAKPAMKFDISEVLDWNDDAVLPLFPSNESAGVFRQLRKAPRLDLDVEGQWRAWPNAELHATHEKPLMDFSKDCPKGFWPVYKGESFDLWQADKGKYYAWADPKVVLSWLQDKRLRANHSSRNSVHKEFPRKYIEDEKTLAPHHTRIAFRDITNRTNSRTVIACLIPPKVFITHTAPVLMFHRGDRKDEAYLLGILSSRSLDWYARRFVELHLTFFLFNPLPIPRPERSNLLWQRVVELAGRLACPDKRFAKWAAEVGVEYGALDPKEKDDKIHELDAVVAHLYGLTAKQLSHIYQTFHENWDYRPALQKTIEYYREWSNIQTSTQRPIPPPKKKPR